MNEETIESKMVPIEEFLNFLDFEDVPDDVIVTMCSNMVDIMYDPEKTLTLAGNDVSGKDKDEICQKLNIKPYLCWYNERIFGGFMGPLGVLDTIKNGVSVIPVMEVIKVYLH